MSITNSINLEEQLILNVAVNAFKHNTINDNIVAKNDVAKIDWDKFITLAIDQSLTFICYKTLNSILPEQYLNKLRLIYTFNSKKVNNDVAICDCLFRLAKTNGFHPVLGKGFRLSKLIYNDIYIRQYDDIDIYICHEELSDFCRLISQYGYICQNIKNVPNIDLIDWANLYTTVNEVHFLPNSNIVNNIEVKSCDAFSLFNYELVREACKNRVTNNYLNKCITTMDETYSLLYLFMNTYKNHFQPWEYYHQKTIRDLVDIYTWDTLHKKYDYSQLYKLAARHKLLDYIICVLNLVSNIYTNRSTMLNYFKISPQFSSNISILEILRTKGRRFEYRKRIINEIILTKFIFLSNQYKKIDCAKTRIPYISQETTLYARKDEFFLWFKFENLLIDNKDEVLMRFWKADIHSVNSYFDEFIITASGFIKCNDIGVTNINITRNRLCTIEFSLQINNSDYIF